MNYKKAYKLAVSIIKIKSGRATVEDRQILLEWLQEREENVRLYKDIIRGISIRERLLLEEKISGELDYNLLKKEIIQKLIIRRRQKRRIRILYGFSGVAASVIILFYIFFSDINQPHKIPTNFANLDADAKVKLILYDGTEMMMDDSSSFVRELGGSEAGMVKEKGKLSFFSGKKIENSEYKKWHKIITKRGGTFSLVLSDGTKVWLNAETTLEFPLDFTNDERRVKLNGEAYFEVAKDQSSPFYVETSLMETKVLGTSFNIQAYEEEYLHSTTLITGRIQVKVNHTDEKVMLEPGYKVEWNSQTDILAKRSIEPADEIAWLQGEFIFENQDLTYVLRMLTRLYNVDFIYPDTLKGKHTFTGRINRESILEENLELIELAGGPEFKREENKIFIIEK